MGGNIVSPEAQRIAIAEVCGWKHIAFNRGWVKAGDGENQCVIPDYLNDLNAMHEAEKALGQPLCYQYAERLMKLHYTGRTPFVSVHATAAQRAEAFLRTLGKWEDGK